MYRLGDVTVYGRGDEADRWLATIHAAVDRCCDWITSNAARNERSVALHSLLRQAAPFLTLAIPTQTHGLPVIAFSCRMLLELELRTAHVVNDNENLRQWMAEGVTDGVDVIRGFMTVRSNVGPSDPAGLQAEVDHLRALARKHQLPENAPLLSVHQLAKSVGRKEDYDTFFKLLSKLIHASSYLVNGLADANDRSIRELLVRSIQLHGLNQLETVRMALGVPEEVTSPTGKPPSRGLGVH